MKKYAAVFLISILLGISIWGNIYLINRINNTLESFAVTQNSVIEKQNEISQNIKYLFEQLEITPAEISAYAPYDNISGMCNDGDIVTASGTIPCKGTLAGNIKLTPFGTKVIIPGFGIHTVEDRCPYYEKKGVLGFDIFAESYEKAITIGRRVKNVLILKT